MADRPTSIEISEAENGCLVRCTYKKEKTDKKQMYDDYETKTYIATSELMDKILEEVGEEVEEEKPKSKREYGRVTKLR